MKLNLKSIPTVFSLFLVLVNFISCSKDSDLLSDYVINDSDTISEIEGKVVDDNFFIAFDSSVILNVLENDNFDNSANVTIVSVTNPSSGTILINDDNTLTYTPYVEQTETEGQEDTEEQEETQENEETEDTFVYTTEEVNEDGETSTEDGNVTVSNKDAEDNIKNSFWTKTQMETVKQRLVNGWSNPNFPNEVRLLEDAKNYFMSNPESTRYLNIDKNTPIGAYSIEYDANTSFSYEPLVNNNTYIDYPFKAAIWGRAFEDVEIANTLLTELLWYTDNADYDFSNGAKFPRDRRADINPYFTMMAWVGKWHEIYREYIKDYSAISENQIAQIERWFGGAADWGFHTADVLLTRYLGSNWIYSDNERSIGLSNSGSPIIEDSNGNPYIQYKISDISSAFNNRLWDSIEFVHNYGIHSNNQLYRDMGVTFFKYSIKYHVYPNGLIGEMKRVTANDPSIGLAYCHVILTGMVRLAHTEEMAARVGLIAQNGWSPENLYDYETTEGHITGKVYDGYVYNGGSTTNGNPKSLRLALTATSKFYRSPQNGGFDPKFYYSGKEISGENRKYPTLFGMANSYYKDSFLFEHAMMDTGAGLPSGNIDPQNGYGLGVMAWGKGLSPILWIEMENNIFD